MSDAEPSPIAAALEEAPEAPASEKPAPISRDERLHKQALEMLEVPQDLPIEPLGINGDVYFYLDGLQQLRPLKAKDHSRTQILSLFAKHEDYLLEKWGRRDKMGLTGGLHTDAVSNVLMKACADAGILDPRRQVRFVGAWNGGDGRLVLHLGSHVHIDGEYKRPGRYGEHVYPAAPPTLRPARQAQNGDAAGELLDLLKTWNWQDPLMPRLALGWIGQGFVAGALGWRTHGICDGERGSGKSSLLKLVEGIFSSWLLATSDTSAAALYQLMAGRGHPVFIDEFEAGDDPQRKAKVVQLLRQASSGGQVLRGGDDHVGKQFTVQFPAFLTSIAPVALQPQDESRMVRFKLLPLPEGSAAPDLSAKRLEKLGARLMRRMLDQWPRFEKVSAIYRATLEEIAGFDARLQDTYGALLACAEMLLNDGDPDPVDIGDLCERLATSVQPARAEELSDQMRCLEYLFGTLVDRGGGPKRSVASWVRQTQAVNTFKEPDHDARREANKALGVIGLAVEAAGDGTFSLFVSNNNPQLVRIFDGTPWPGSAGSKGAWAHVMRRIEGATAAGPMRVGGMLTRGTMVPISGIDWEDEPCAAPARP